MSNDVFVIDTNKKPMSPCHPAAKAIKWQVVADLKRDKLN
jgi:hypothetical protein